MVALPQPLYGTRDGRACHILVGHAIITSNARFAPVGSQGGNVDAELATVISTAATTLVRLLATDGWERAKTALGSLWRRAHPDQPDAIDTDLADSRAAVLAARDSGNEQAERDLESEWRGRLRYLVAADPALIAGLSELVQDLRAALSAVEHAQGGHIEMHAHASGHAQVFQAGRDQNIRR